MTADYHFSDLLIRERGCEVDENGCTASASKYVVGFYNGARFVVRYNNTDVNENLDRYEYKIIK